MHAYGNEKEQRGFVELAGDDHESLRRLSYLMEHAIAMLSYTTCFYDADYSWFCLHRWLNNTVVSGQVVVQRSLAST